MICATLIENYDKITDKLDYVYLGADKGTIQVNIVVSDITIADIDEALGHLRLKIQDRYRNRLTYNQRQFYLEQINDLLDARNELANEGK